MRERRRAIRAVRIWRARCGSTGDAVFERRSVTRAPNRSASWLGTLLREGPVLLVLLRASSPAHRRTAAPLRPRRLVYCRPGEPPDSGLRPFSRSRRFCGSPPSACLVPALAWASGPRGVAFDARFGPFAVRAGLGRSAPSGAPHLCLPAATGPRPPRAVFHAEFRRKQNGFGSERAHYTTRFITRHADTIFNDFPFVFNLKTRGQKWTRRVR